MKIAMVLAICVIFSSGTYAAFAEEPIPTLNFEGGDYTVYRGNDLIIPVKVEIENHDPKIIPKILTIHENKVVDVIQLRQSNSGSYLTYLDINENYPTGTYSLKLDYSNKNVPEIEFNVLREFGGKENIKEDNSKFLNPVYIQKESFIDVSEKNIDIEFSTIEFLSISGEFFSSGQKGKLKLMIDGPKSMTNYVRMTESGQFDTNIIIDKEWPTGKYIITGNFFGEEFARNEFTVKNFNKDSLLKNDSLMGTINLDVQKSNQYNILLIDGKLEGQQLPEIIGIKILKDEEEMNISYIDIKSTGEYETNLVLFDYAKKLKWPEGTYNIEIINSATLEPYDISTIFKITEYGTAITDMNQGALISTEDEIEFLEVEHKLEVKKYSPKEINVFGIIDSYLIGTPIEISIVRDDGDIKEFSVFGKKNGDYLAPIIIDEKWLPGEYDIFVKYMDTIVNTLSFIVTGDNVSETELISIDENLAITNEQNIQSFEIIQKDSYQNQFVNLNFITNSEISRFERLLITLEKPDGSTSTYNVRTDLEGNFSTSLFVQNSWDEGKYTLSFLEKNENVKFGEFVIKKEKIHEEIIVLSEVLETANPESLYEKINEFNISKKALPIVRGGVPLDVSGTVSEDTKVYVNLHVYENNEPFGEYNVMSKTNGEFFGTVLLDDSISDGFHEIHASNNDKIIGKSEFLIIKPVSIFAKFESKPIKISRDMFVESGNLITLNVVGLIKNYSYNDYDTVKFTILHPDGKIVKEEVSTAKWGYYSYSLPLSNNFDNGTYVISAQFNGERLGHMYLQITDFDINWFKAYTQKWVDNEISTYQYENKINNLIEENVIEIEPVGQDSIPDWAKMNGQKWLEGSMTQKEYFEIIKFVS